MVLKLGDAVWLPAEGGFLMDRGTVIELDCVDTFGDSCVRVRTEDGHEVLHDVGNLFTPVDQAAAVACLEKYQRLQRGRWVWQEQAA